MNRIGSVALRVVIQFCNDHYHWGLVYPDIDDNIYWCGWSRVALLALREAIDRCLQAGHCVAELELVGVREESVYVECYELANTYGIVRFNVT